MQQRFRAACVLARLMPLCWVFLYGAMSACTVPSPWGAQGTDGQPCFSGETCDKGLVCLAEGNAHVCRRGSGGPDGGIDGIPSSDSACWLKQGVQLSRVPRLLAGSNVLVVEGRADEGITEILLLGPGVEQTSEISKGTFCLEAKLVAQGATYNLYGRNAQGCLTEAIRVEAHETLGINVLAGRIPEGPWQREVRSLTDGSDDTTVQLSVLDPSDPSDREYCNEYAYVWFSLPSTLPIGRVAIRYPEAVAPHYIVCWSLAGSAERDPAPPWPSVVNPWEFIDQSTHGSEGDLLIDLVKPPRLRHIAVLMYEDAQPGVDTETFEIAEIEAWRPPSAEEAGCN